MRYEAVLFDMDGTLLDTLEDLRDAVNHLLTENGWETRTLEEIRQFIGGGARKLLERSIPETVAPQRFEQLLADYRAWYEAHSAVKTAPYPGIPEVLAELSRRGVKTAVVSNKPDEATRRLAALFFPGVPAWGQREGLSPKPAPDLVRCALSALDTAPAGAVYVGDSEVDVATGLQAGLDMIGVSWGFRGREILEGAGAPQVVDTAEELLRLL